MGENWSTRASPRGHKENKQTTNKKYTDHPTQGYWQCHRPDGYAKLGDNGGGEKYAPFLAVVLPNFCLFVVCLPA